MLVREATFLWVDGTPTDFSTLHTLAGNTLPNPPRTRGSPLAGAPAFQGNIRARYGFALNDYDAVAPIVAVRRSHSLATTEHRTPSLQGSSTAYDLAAFTTCDGAVGVQKMRGSFRCTGRT